MLQMLRAAMVLLAFSPAALSPTPEHVFSPTALAEVKRMDAKAVGDWLRNSLHLADPAATFELNGVDGAALLEVQKEQLKDELGVWKVDPPPTQQTHT